MRERRHVPRYLSDLHGEVFEPTRPTQQTVGILILSVDGACVDRAGFLSRGVKCTLRLDWHERHFEVEAEVVWTNSQGRAGLKFTSMDEDSRKLIREILPNLPLQPMVKLPPERK